MTWTQPDSTSWSATYNSGDSAFFTGSGTGTVTISGGTVTPLSVNVSAGNYTFSGGSLTTTGDIYVTSNGALTLSSNVTVGNTRVFAIGTTTSASTSAMVINSGVLNVGGGGGAVMIGGGAGTSQAGKGSLVINGGTVSVGAAGSSAQGVDASKLWLNGYGLSGSSASIDLNGGVLSTARVIENGSTVATAVVNLNGGTLQAAGAIDLLAAVSGRRITVNVLSGGAIIDTQAFNASISEILRDGGGGGGLTKNGTGTLTLSGANTYNGTTTINAGTLTIGAADRIADTSNLNVAGGTFNLGGFNETLGSITGSGNITLGSGNITTNSTTNSTFSGLISGTGALTKNGTGTLTLSGANTYNGTTTINAGTLSVSGTTSSSAITINSGGNLTGTGTVGVVTLNTGGMIGAGTGTSTVGKLTGTSLTVGAGTGYAFTIGNISGGTVGTAGTDYDQLTTTGAITFNNTVANPFTVYLNGTPTNWSSSGSYTWNILSGASLSGFSSGNFIADTSAFGASLASGASFTFGTSGGNLTLTYGSVGTPVWAGGTGVWSGNFTPSLSNNLPIVFTGAGGTATNDIGNATLSAVGAITFNSTAGAYTLAANAGSAGNGTALAVNGDITNNSANLQTINTALSLSVNRTINTAAGNITIGGAISGAGGITKNGSSTLTLSANNTYTGATTISAGTLEVSSTGLLGGGSYFAAISNAGSLLLGSNSNQTLGGVISGAGALTKNGTGSLILSGANTYTGNTTVNSGTLLLSGAGKVGPGSLSVASGATFALNSWSQTVAGLSGAGNITWGQSASTVSDGSALISSAKNYTQKLDFGLGGGATVNGVVFNHADTSGTGWALTGAGSRWNSESGSGYAQLMSDFYYGGNPGALTFTGLTTGAYYEAVVYTQIGSWGDRPQNATFSNNGSTQFTLSNIQPEKFGAVVYSFQAQGTNASITMAPTAAGSFHWFGASLELVGTQTLTVGDSGNYDFSGVISGPIALNKVGSGTQTLSGNNTYTGGTTLNAGQLNINSATALGTGNFTIAGGTIDNTSGSAKTLTNNNTQNWNADFTFAGTNDLNMGTGNVTMNASRTVTVNAGNFTVGGIISGASMGLTKNGSGTLVLSGANTYNGTTTINAGTLSIGAVDRIADTSNLNVAGGTFDLGGFNETLGSITGSGNITLGAGTLTTNSTSNTTFSGLISGTGGLTKNGTSTLTLSGNNTYNGTTTISAGTIEIAAAGRLGAGNYTGNISNSGVLIYSGTNNQILGGVISGSGALTQNGSGTLTLNGNNTYTGTTTINTGTLQISSTGLLGGGNYSGNISNSGTFDFASNSNQTLSGVISGIGALTKNGTGTLTLAGNNNYSGGTTLNTGTLVIGNAAAAGTGTITQANGSSLLKIDTTGTISNDMSVYNVLASQSATLSGAITVNNATWDIDTGDTLTISGAVSGNGGVTKNGGGRLTLNGTNTYNGSTIVNSGTLEAASANALGSNNTVQVNGGSLLVSTDNALNNKSLTLNSTSIAGLAFSGNYSGRVNNLTLSQNSIIDLGDGSVSIMFDTFVMNSFTLDIYNWTGTTLWNGGTGNDTDKVYFGPDLSDTALAKIYFHSGAVGGGDSFLGSGFELMPRTTFEGGLGYQIIPVPEPETYATGLLLLLGSAWWMWKRKPKAV
jgi:autotransporter-associated beta strand protein